MASNVGQRSLIETVRECLTDGFRNLVSRYMVTCVCGGRTGRTSHAGSGHGRRHTIEQAVAAQVAHVPTSPAALGR